MRSAIFNFEDSSIDITPKSWEEFHGISLCLIVMNEQDNLKDFFEWHRPYVDNIVVIDGGSSDDSVNIASEHASVIKKIKFTGHYGNQKNRAIESATNDWVLFLDPDERLSEAALKNLRSLTDQNEYDCYSFPRKNIVDGTPDLSHGADHQTRLFRAYCRYVRPTHEELVGFKKIKIFEDASDYHMIHTKGTDRHLYRNSLYFYFDMKYAHEKGCPGSQTSESFKSEFKVFCSSLDQFKVDISTRHRQ